MKKRGMRNFFILFTIIVVLLLQSSLVSAQPQSGYHPGCFFNLQFVMNLSWSGNDTQEPISPGETREVHLTISSTVTRGAYGRILLQILEGGTYPIQLFVEEKPEWCIAWTSQENFTGVILPNEMCTQNTLLYIHLNDDAPSNYTLGWVKLRCAINDKKGPFNILTLIHGYENTFTLSFIPGP